MKTTTMVMICRLLIVSMMCLSFQSAHASMIGAHQVVAASSGQADRDAVMRVMGRTEVSSQLQSMGLSPEAAKDRVAAMTDEEVRSLAGKLQSLPAGADGDWGWWLAAVIVIALVIYYNYGWKK